MIKQAQNLFAQQDQAVLKFEDKLLLDHHDLLSKFIYKIFRNITYPGFQYKTDLHMQAVKEQLVPIL